MIAFALKLLLAHVLGDFVLQPYRWVERKRQKKHRSGKLYIHLAIHALALLLLLEFNPSYWIGIAVILVTHFIIDLLKVNLEKYMSPGWSFILDQIAHLLVISLVVYSYHPFSVEITNILTTSSLLFMLAILGVTSVSAILMRLAMNRWQLPEDREGDSLPHAGKFIGILERLFVFLFIVLQQWPAIGWLVAAKSILRFSDLSRAKDRKLTEYVLIGTLLSFGMAIGIGLGYLHIRQQIGE